MNAADQALLRWLNAQINTGTRTVIVAGFATGF
jgi:hypothetical protein